MINNIALQGENLKEKIHTFFNKIGFFSCIMLGFWSCISTAGGSISMGLLFLCFLLSGQWQKKLALLKHPLMVVSILFFCWEMIGVLYSVGEWQSSFGFAFKYQKLCIIWCAMFFIDGKGTRFNWMLGGLIVGIMANILAIYMNYFVLPSSSSINFMGGNWPAAISHGPFAVLALVFAFAILIAAKDKKRPMKWRLVLMVAGVLALIAEVFLNSARSGYVMEAVVILCLILQMRKLAPIVGLFIFGIGLFGSAYLFSPIFKQRVNLAATSVVSYVHGTTDRTSAGTRLSFWVTSLHILIQNPSKWLFGHGTGSYQAVTTNYAHNLPKKDKNPNFRYRGFPNPHNQYLTFFLENGIIGLSLFFLFLYGIWRYGKSLPDPWRSLSWVTLIGVCTNMMFNATFMDFITSIFFVTVLALLAAVSPHSTLKSLKSPVPRATFK